jgi:hypothetical protein
MRTNEQIIGKRPVVVSPGRRWPEPISRMKPSWPPRASRSVDEIQRRARQAQVQERSWGSVPDPRWHRGRR